MTTPMPAAAVLEREYLELRAKILQLAASLDRLDRGAGHVADDPRLQKIQAGIDILKESESGRAERLQLLFSRPYDPQWDEALANESPG